MKLYVGNLSVDVTESDLRLLFGRFGKIESVAVAKDPESGVSRGFAFVEMPQGAANVVLSEVNEMELRGNVISVSPAQETENPRDFRAINRKKDRRHSGRSSKDGARAQRNGRSSGSGHRRRGLSE
jgi:RNA recognition motif-containing protein